MITVEDLRALDLFDGVTDEQLAALLAASSEVDFASGDVLWTEGDLADSWWVLVEGEVELTRQSGSTRNVVGRFDAPGRWAGGFRAWDDDGRYLASGHATSSGRMLEVPVSALRDLFVGYPLASRLMEGLFHTARNVEATTRQREALEALGRLSAGLAHELNNPIAAATRAVDLMSGESRALLASLRQLAEGDLSPAQFAGLDELRSTLQPPAVPDERALAAAEDALADWLEVRDVDRAWLLGAPLAAAGADTQWCDRVADLVPERSLSAALAWVAAVVSLESLVAEVKEATRRVSALVADVKSYTQMDRAAMQRVDITEGLESTLTMLAGRLDGISVERDYSPDVPALDVYASELNQVWTNLIANAVDAMHGSGTLRLATRVEGERVVIEITDSGEGIPPDAVANVFEPFFTTKGVGGGTGLGLDISRRIVVDRHGGSIGVESEPGRTVFRVALPLR